VHRVEISPLPRNVEWLHHGAAFRRRITVLELQQIIGRGRGLWRTADCNTRPRRSKHPWGGAEKRHQSCSVWIADDFPAIAAKRST
jgi:hypothetical protein